MPENETDDGPDEQVAVTGRPNDIPIKDPEDRPDVLRNSTLKDRAKARRSASTKQVDEADNKAVQEASNKAQRRTRKKA